VSVSESLSFRVAVDHAAFDRGMRKVEQGGKRAGDAVERAFKGAGDAGGGAGRETEKAFKGANRELKETTKRAQLSRASLTRIGGALTAGAAAAAAFGTGMAAVATGAIQTGAEFEMLETRLGTLMSSAEAGKRRMAELFEFASTTPFELNELVEAEVNLRALGVNAEKALPMIMDFAGAMGVDVASAAVEVGRAMQFGAGAVETISGRALRAQVELRTGQDALKMSTEEFREAMIATLTDEDGIFAGGTQKLASTFSGLMSNMSDAFTRFRKDIADAGLFDGVKGGAAELIDLMNENQEEVTELAETISVGLLAAIQMTVQGVGYLADGWTIAQAGAKGAVMVSEEAAASFSRFMEAQVRDFEDLFATLGAAAEAIGLDALGEKFASAERGFKGLADTVGAGAAGMEADAAATREEYEALVQTIGDATADANRLISAMDARSGGSRTLAGGGGGPGAPAAPAAGGGGGGTAGPGADSVAAINAITAAQMEQEQQAFSLNAALEERSAIYQRLMADSMTFDERESANLASKRDQLAEFYTGQIEAAEGNFNAQLALRKQWEEDDAAMVEAHEERISQMRTAAYAQTAGMIADTAGKLAQLVGDRNEEAAMRAFKIAKAAGIVQATINGALAVSKALSEVPYPANFAVAALTGAAVAVEVATIASQQPPSFEDTPGVVQVSSSGGTLAFGGGDFVAAGKDPDDLRRQVNRMDDNNRDRRQGERLVMPVFEGRTWEIGTRDQTRRPGPLRDAIRGTSTGAVGRSGF